jgi:hypothetical protein
VEAAAHRTADPPPLVANGEAAAAQVLRRDHAAGDDALVSLAARIYTGAALLELVVDERR